MKTNSELKNRAIDALTGNWGLGAVITLVYGLVMNAPTLPYRIMESVASSSFSLIALLLLPLGFGYTVLFLDVIRGIKLDFARLFDGFKELWTDIGYNAADYSLYVPVDVAACHSGHHEVLFICHDALYSERLSGVTVRCCHREKYGDDVRS